MNASFLRQELEAKTKLLEKTSEALLESQRQYQKLLNLYEEEKIKNKIFNDSKCSQETLNSNQSYNKPVFQYDDINSTIQKLSSQINSLKSYNEYLLNDNNKWSRFSVHLYRALSQYVDVDQSFPIDDTEAQRDILEDCVSKLLSQINHHNSKGSFNKPKSYDSKGKKNELQSKERNHINEENDDDEFDLSLFDSRQKYKSLSNVKKQGNRSKYSTSNNDQLDIFKNHIKDLTHVTKNMKNQYINMYLK